MTGPSKVGDVIAPPRPWMTSEPLFCVFSQLVLLRQSFVGHSGHMAEPVYLYFLNSDEKWFHIQVSANFTASHFVAKCHTVDSKNPISAACS